MQYVQRQSAAIKDFIVEGAKVKFVAKLLARFFTQLESGSVRQWWKLVPHDNCVSSDPNPADGSTGHSYCLADPGQSYIVYTENTKATDLFLNEPPNATFRVTRFDPRSGKRTLLDASVRNGTAFTLSSPDTEDWVYEAQKN